MVIEDIKYNSNFFNSFIKTIFAESFSHSSLSFEEVFYEEYKSSRSLKEFINDENTRYAMKLLNGTEEDKEKYYKQIEMVKQQLIRLGVSEKQDLSIPLDERNISIEDFKPYFNGLIRPFISKRELAYAKENGYQINSPIEEETLIDRYYTLVNLVTTRFNAYKEAYTLKKGNTDALLYAINSKKLGVKEIKRINSLVTCTPYDETSYGYKTSDNQIINASFETCDKNLVPSAMIELLYKYENEWNKLIPDSTSDPNYKKMVCLREALFHIYFERIHPFGDGNGRTGRIILNKHLLDNHMAPVLITPEMRSEYIKCINNKDYERLANLFNILSSATQTLMVASYRKACRIDSDEIDLGKKKI